MGFYYLLQKKIINNQILAFNLGRKLDQKCVICLKMNKFEGVENLRFYDKNRDFM